MALLSANGGSVTLNASPDITWHVTSWQIDDGARLADTSTSAQAYSVFLSCLGEVSWSFDLPVDAASTPAAGGLTPGAIVDLYFRVGSSNTYHRVQSTTVERITPVNDNTGQPYRETVTGRGGTITRYGAAPS